jgi:acyl-CoA thioesterase-1
MVLFLLLGFHSCGYANHSATRILILGDSLSAAHNIPVDKGWAQLFIELGGNDGLRGLGFEQSTENLRQMVQLAEAKSITLLLIGVRMPPNFGAAYNTRFQQIFESTAAEFEIHYLARFLDGIAASDPALMQADGIHPTAIAQPLLAQKVETKMIQILNH